MSETDDLKKKMEALTEKMEGLESKNSELATKLDEQKSAKLDITKQRDELKTKLKDAESGKETENATVEQMKELLKQKEVELSESNNQRKSDKIEAKLIQAALKANFVTDKAGKINAKILKSEIDISKLHLDDDGEIIGLDSMLNKVRENSPFLFDKKKASSKETKDDPQNKQAEDLSLDGVTDFHARRAIMRKRGEKHEEAEKNGLPSGMGDKTTETKEPEKSASFKEGGS